MNTMMKRLACVTAMCVLAIEGCQHCCYRPVAVPGVAAFGSGGCNGGAKPGALPGYQPVPQAPAAPVPIAPELRGYPPGVLPEQPTWRSPLDGGARLGSPDGSSSQAARDSARLLTPDFNPLPPGPPKEDRAPTPLLPAGIPQFALAKDRVASGLRPSMDGIEWLRENGYRTVLHLRQPGEDDAADRQYFEARGSRFQSLDVSPQTLSKKIVDDFNRIVTDSANQPLFVYDKDGVIAGGLWYLHSRTIDRLTDQEARTRAARLGLREEPNGAPREMWVAIQKYLSEQAK